MEEEQKSDVEVLFPEQEIYGVKLRPWTFDQFVRIMPNLLKMRKDFAEVGIGFERFEGIDENNMDSALELLGDIAPLIPATEVVSKTTDIDIAEVRKWFFDKTTAIFLLIMIQNLQRVKNLFGLGTTVLSNLKKTD